VNNDVYVAGSQNVTSGVYAVKLWKNGAATTLSTPGHNASANTIFAANNNIYVGGYEDNGVFRSALIWNNNTSTNLLGFCYPSGSCTFDYSQVTSMYVSGSDVYAVGTSIKSTGSYDSIMWKNGAPTRISILPNSIFVSNNDIYIAGRVGNYASIWKNGTITQLTNGVNQAFATSVFVIGSDVYASGYEKINGTINCIVKFWKNGVATNLTDGTTTGIGYSIYAQ
jgi:hypothetical protein